MTDRPPRVALIGMGRMGRTLEQLAPERGWDVVARISRESNENGSGITRRSLGGADVAIEFTEPSSVLANIRAAVNAGCPIVVGTTGWNDRVEDAERLVREGSGAMIVAANFSIGVTLFTELAAQAARLFSDAPGFDMHLIETHHAAKKDAPSGTALKLADALRTGGARSIPITSVRTGHVPGIHEIVLDAPFESIRLVHEARDRRVFAEGALVAAAWLIGKRGVFSMGDVLRGESRGAPS